MSRSSERANWAERWRTWWPEPAARAVLALERLSSRPEIALPVLGVPPDPIVILWERAAIAGLAATQLLDEGSRRRLGERIARLWPPGPFALATAAVKIVEAILA